MSVKKVIGIRNVSDSRVGIELLQRLYPGEMEEDRHLVLEPYGSGKDFGIVDLRTWRWLKTNDVFLDGFIICDNDKNNIGLEENMEFADISDSDFCNNGIPDDKVKEVALLPSLSKFERSVIKFTSNIPLMRIARELDGVVLSDEKKRIIARQGYLISYGLPVDLPMWSVDKMRNYVLEHPDIFGSKMANRLTSNKDDNIKKIIARAVEASLS